MKKKNVFIFYFLNLILIKKTFELISRLSHLRFNYMPKRLINNLILKNS